jgi:hypothetical protein
MSRSARYLINAGLLVLVGAHAVWWFAIGRAEFATDMAVWLRVAQGVLGFAGAIWFYSRSRGVANPGS